MSNIQNIMPRTSSHNTRTLGKSASQDGTSIDLKAPMPSSSPTAVYDLFTNTKKNLDENGTRSPKGVDDYDDCQTIMSQIDLAQIPERLVDFFCIVGHHLKEIRDFAETPSDLHLQPSLLDCYPKYRTDMDLPKELPMFCFPHKCQLSTCQAPPAMSTFVLTTGKGNHLFGTVLTHYELVPLEDLCAAFWTGDCILPAWLEEPKPFFLPKSIVVISHHGFFEVQRVFLQQLYRIVTCPNGSPLPLERYIANFCHDVPLPRPGASTVSWRCFTKDAPLLNYRRPAVNELPLVNISYQPLLRCLSVANILTLWGVLLQEGRVVLLSEHASLLTPIAEALTSLLFPLKWTGVYVPILPSTMTNILEAPVPFLVGILCGSNACPQPHGVVVCDIDQDIVHLGATDGGIPEPRTLPQLPKKLVSTLQLELEDVADPLYLIPPCGTKGRITSAVHGLLENSMREAYAYMYQLRSVSLTNTHREYILEHSGLIPEGSQQLRYEDFLKGPSEEQTLYKSDGKHQGPNQLPNGNLMMKVLRRHGRALQVQTNHAFSTTSSGTAQYDEEMDKRKDCIASSMHDVDDVLARKVRYAFLRFFSNLLQNYNQYAVSISSTKLTQKSTIFLPEDFVNSLENEMSYGSRIFVLTMVQTQMFERFLVESSTLRHLFDEYILLQRNQEAFAGLIHKRHETPFLDESSGSVHKIIIPAAPCSAGVPPDRVYKYENYIPFELQKNELVANKTIDPVTALCYLGDLMLCGAGEMIW